MTNKHLTINEAKAIVKALDMSFVRLPDTEEFKVNIPRYRGGSEETAYYTTDLLDAVHTAESMASWAAGVAQVSNAIATEA
jgi:hypothetical protein